MKTDLPTVSLDLVSEAARDVAQAIVNGMADAAVLLTAEFQPANFNYAWALMTGLKRRELEKRLKSGATAFDLLEGEGGPLKKAADLAIGELREMRLDALPIRNAVGQSINVQASILPLRDPALRLVGLLMVLRDITAEVAVQDKYKEMLALEKVRGDQLEREVEARTRDLRAALDQVTRMSRTDPLTGLLNRRAFSELAEQALNMAARHKRTVAVILCDLDHFKKMNDTFGHQAGDTVLVSTADALSKAVRATDSVARFGGEEFIILLSETEESHVLEVARRCHERVREIPVQSLIPGVTKPQTVSVGVALFPKDGDSLDALTKSADRALYQAKADGRDRVVQYGPHLKGGTPQEQKPLLKVLLAIGEEATVWGLKERLAGKFDVSTASTVAEGLDQALENLADVLVIDSGLDKGAGLDLAHSSSSVLPHAFRVLLVPSPGEYAELRRENTTIDLFLLKSEALEKLEDAIHDGLAQRQVASLESARGLIRPGTETVNRLDQLISNEALKLHFQPLIDLRVGSACAWEALSRVDEPMFLNPATLFDVAVSAGRIWKLGRLVRRRAREAMGALMPAEYLFLNLHPAEIDDPHWLEDGDLLQWAPRLVLEITERASLPDLRRFRTRMKQLREVGYRFAIDDLGAGYASLNALALLEPDFVKLDRLTVQALADSSPLRTLVRRIVDFANDVGIFVIGEGVENETQLRLLRDVGCHWGQGYFFGRPSPQFDRSRRFLG